MLQLLILGEVLQSSKVYLPADFSRCLYSVALEMCRVSQTSVTLAFGLSKSALAIVIFRASIFRGRPPFLPRARAARNPAWVRSQMSSLSNSDRAPNT